MINSIDFSKLRNEYIGNEPYPHIIIDDFLEEKLCKDLDIKMEEVAYIGDDINDILLLREVGISASPSNASNYIKENVDFVTELKGGEGAFREFVETILIKNDSLDKAINMFLDNQLILKQ